jgi:CxxC-x17-CxxC domain-containing protein
MQQFQDRDLTCVECGAVFSFTADDQAYHAEKGYANEPKRCPDCRNARRRDGGSFNSGPRSDRQMYPAVCAECGKETEVPFEPRDGRPVYCGDCYRNKRPVRY